MNLCDCWVQFCHPVGAWLKPIFWLLLGTLIVIPDSFRRYVTYFLGNVFASFGEVDFGSHARESIFGHRGLVDICFQRNWSISVHNKRVLYNALYWFIKVVGRSVGRPLITILTGRRRNWYAPLTGSPYLQPRAPTDQAISWRHCHDAALSSASSSVVVLCSFPAAPKLSCGRSVDPQTASWLFRVKGVVFCHSYSFVILANTIILAIRVTKQRQLTLIWLIDVGRLYLMRVHYKATELNWSDIPV